MEATSQLGVTVSPAPLYFGTTAYSRNCTGSQERANLYKALALAQAEMQIADLDSINPHFQSKYASLQSVWGVLRGVLGKHGLSLVQVPGYDEALRIATLTTILTHSSGEFITGIASLTIDKPTAHAWASAITYLRRISASAFCGVATGDVDDDGNAAVVHQVSNRQTGIRPQTTVAEKPKTTKERDPESIPVPLPKIKPVDGVGPAPTGGPSRERVMARVKDLWNEILDLGEDPAMQSGIEGVQSLADVEKYEINKLMEVGIGLSGAVKEIKRAQKSTTLL